MCILYVYKPVNLWRCFLQRLICASLTSNDWYGGLNQIMSFKQIIRPSRLWHTTQFELKANVPSVNIAGKQSKLSTQHFSRLLQSGSNCRPIWRRHVTRCAAQWTLVQLMDTIDHSIFTSAYLKWITKHSLCRDGLCCYCVYVCVALDTQVRFIS